MQITISGLFLRIQHNGVTSSKGSDFEKYLIKNAATKAASDV
jgi:hypothetical protein